MQVTLYKNFKKKINSTKQPSGGAEKEVYLKDGCSIENPVFLIDGIDLDVNYIKFNNDYFYVNDIILSNNNIYEVHCSMDPLASHKDEILDTTAYVKYSQSKFNKWIPDERISMTDEIETSTSSRKYFGPTEGSYVINIAGDNRLAGEAAANEGQVGFTGMFIVSSSEVRNLVNKFYNTEFPIDKMFGDDPFKAIISAHWVPWYTSHGTLSNVYMGSALKTSNILCQGKGIGNFFKGNLEFYNQEFPIPWKYNDWRDFAPYSQWKIYLPFLGFQEIDMQRFQGLTTLKIKFEANFIDGSFKYTIAGVGGSGPSADRGVLSYEGKCLIPLSLGQDTNRSIQGISEIGNTIVGAGASVAGGIITGNPLAVGAGAIQGISGITQGALNIAFGHDIDAKGNTGGSSLTNALGVLSSASSDYSRYVILLQTSHKFSQDPSNINAIEGRPLYETTKLSTLSGYVKCEGASVNMSGLERDKEEINSYLNGPGIFIE